MKPRGLPPPSLVDRAISYFAPVHGVRRMAARAALGFAYPGGAPGQHEGARLDRNATRNWLPRAQSADADSSGDLTILRARTRDLVRNAPIARGAIRTNVTNVVGGGLRLRATIDGEFLGLTEQQEEKAEKEVERIWRAWSESHFCDITRSQDFAGLCGLVYQAALESGDVLAIRRSVPRPGAVLDLALQVIEADRVCTPYGLAEHPGYINGVEKDVHGAAVRYHVANRHPVWSLVSDGLGPLEWTAVPAYGAKSGERLALLLMDKERPGQSRGIPYLAPVVEALKQLSRYTDAELTAAVISSFFTVFTKTPTGEGIDEGTAMAGAPQNASAGSGGLALGPGAILDLAPGEDVTFANPQRPNTAFDKFFQAIVRQIGVALEIPFELLIQHFTASYSASRAALEMAWQSFRRRRSWLVSEFVRPVYEWVVGEAVLRGMLDMPGFFEDPMRRRAWLGSEWIGPGRFTLDPLKEANADRVLAELKVKSRAEISIAQTGTDLDRKVSQIQREEALLGPVGSPTPQLPAPAAPPAADDLEEEEE